MAAILLCSDLLFSSRVSAAGERAGVPVVTALGPAALADRLEEHPGALVIVDLGQPGLELAAVVAQLRASACAPREIIAFGPHVQEERLVAARSAGCDLVLTRGQFNGQIDELLARFAQAE